MTSHTRLQRLLEKHETKKELGRSSVRNKLLENNAYKNAQYTSGDLSKYAQLKKKGLNDLDLYRKLYKHRYSKKNVLGKIDCYCEKNIFDKFDYIQNLSERMNIDKKRLKSFFFKKYGSVLIIISLVLLLGIIYPILRYSDLGLILPFIIIEML
ncbi:hypothetical protein PVIIG_05418 [Plasmodium vivax India VII]|uniref:Uncharacterized protein n=1 Tax=Plasmodium vivax India VII TaxID=1077284 RepID=A0A0J9S5T2_PLAVI|nr:hypothetical protein PVIIG_05418 [Plasmodium vivax India VII]